MLPHTWVSTQSSPYHKSNPLCFPNSISHSGVPFEYCVSVILADGGLRCMASSQKDARIGLRCMFTNHRGRVTLSFAALGWSCIWPKSPHQSKYFMPIRSFFALFFMWPALGIQTVWKGCTKSEQSQFCWVCNHFFFINFLDNLLLLSQSNSHQCIL